MNFELPEGILCSKTHEYVYETDNTTYIGITDFAVDQLGDIVFVELPSIDSQFTQGEVFGTLESVKAASEIYAPASFKVIDINEDLISQNIYTAGQPDPDIIVRPSGEYRLSNFLTWQSAYSEFWFSDILWPDFTTDDVDLVLEDFQKRHRRFGGV